MEEQLVEDSAIFYTKLKIQKRSISFNCRLGT